MFRYVVIADAADYNAEAVAEDLANAKVVAPLAAIFATRRGKQTDEEPSTGRLKNIINTCRRYVLTLSLWANACI